MGIKSNIEIENRICYNASRQSDEMYSQTIQQKPRSSHLRGFLSVMAGWINPQADYQLLFSVQPFADVVGDYTCQDRKHK